MSRKKIVILAGVVVFIIALVIVLLAITKDKTPSFPKEENNIPDFPTPEESTTTETKTDPKTGATLRKLSEHEVFDFWGAPETNDMYYVRSDGKVFAAKSGPDLAISEETLTALNRVEASPSSTRVLAAFGSPETPQWAIFRMSDRSWSPLPGNIIEATWGKNENELISLSNQGGVTNLLRLDITKSPPGESVVLKNVTLTDIRLAYSPLQKLYLLEKPSSLYEGRVFQLDLKNNLINLLFSGQRGGVLRFSELRNLVLSYSTQGGTAILKQDLSPIIPEEADADAALVIQTFPEKCDASQIDIICFVPISMPNLSDDYLRGNIFSIDQLRRFDTRGESHTLLASPEESFWGSVDAKKVRVRENKIYFLNRYDNGLYELQLTGDR